MKYRTQKTKFKGKNNPNWRGGKYCKKYTCSNCKKPISLSGKLQKSGLCKSCGHLGKIFSLKHRLNISKNHYDCSGDKNPNFGTTWTIGEGNPNWQNGIGKLPYSFKFTKKLKESIRKKDNYKCQNCGKTQKRELEDLKKKLSIHHIDYNKMNCNLNNLITVCKSCNTKANYNIDYWYAYFRYIKGD